MSTIILAIVEFEIFNEILEEHAPMDIRAKLIDQFVKVKSGEYENILVGEIVDFVKEVNK